MQETILKNGRQYRSHPVLKFSDADPGWKKFGSGIRDKHPGFATLYFTSSRTVTIFNTGNKNHLLPFIFCEEELTVFFTLFYIDILTPILMPRTARASA